MKPERCTCKVCGAEHDKPAPSNITPGQAGMMFGLAAMMFGSAFPWPGAIVGFVAGFALGYYFEWRRWKKAAL